MHTRLQHNVKDLEAAFQAVLDDMPSVLEEIGRYAEVRISAHATSRYMRDGSGDPGARQAVSFGPRGGVKRGGLISERRADDTGPLRRVSGRLSRAAASKFGRGGQREGSAELDVSEGGVKVTKVIDVPYARIQEEGGTITMQITARMRRFFWARFFETGDEKFKWLALTKKRSLTIEIPARPYAAPALADAQPEVEARLDLVVRRRLMDQLATRVG